MTVSEEALEKALERLNDRPLVQQSLRYYFQQLRAERDRFQGKVDEEESCVLDYRMLLDRYNALKRRVESSPTIMVREEMLSEYDLERCPHLFDNELKKLLSVKCYAVPVDQEGGE